MRNWATISPRQQAQQRARDMFGRMGRFVGGARRAVGRGWRRFTTGMAGVTDRVRGRLALRSSFEFRNEEAVGQSELASLASSMTVTAPKAKRWRLRLIQLLAALHTRKVVHGKLEPKSVLLFSHGLLYLSDLGRARRHGEVHDIPSE
ncbi:cAMP-dependent protein kinase [Toxoplasma gondii]|uniref:cAMP-dependent protein kinase n=1 Tax=Toxoplasma gondii TaxID=5811 RepID=A0A7J6KEH2_TOXGO|nr:cAMP-dependent protein kinase [Toxoplasma gondii]